MSVIRRFNKPQGLKDIDFLLKMTTDFIFFNVVEVIKVITQGKVLF